MSPSAGWLAGRREGAEEATWCPKDAPLASGVGLEADHASLSLDLFVPQLLYLPPPWGDCKNGPIESAFFSNYSVAACRIDCETRYLAENCNCRMVHMPGWQGRGGAGGGPKQACGGRNPPALPTRAGLL